MEAHGLFDNIVATDKRNSPLEVLVFGLICEVALSLKKIPISKEGIIGLVLTVRLLPLRFKETGRSGHVKLRTIWSTLTFFWLHGLRHAILVYGFASRWTKPTFLYYIIHMEAFISANVIYDCQTHRFLVETDMWLTSTSTRTSRVSTLATRHKGWTRTVSLTVVWIYFLIFFLLTHRLIYYVYCARLSGSSALSCWVGLCFICCAPLSFFSVLGGCVARCDLEGLADLSHKMSCLVHSV